MSSAITVVDAAWAELKARQAKNIELALPPHLKSEQGFLRYMNQVRVALYKIPRLAQCTPASLHTAFVQCAELGLDPTFRLGSACIVPFKDTATLIIGYRGLIDLAVRSGEVRSVNAWVVHEKDQWSPRTGTMPVHKPYWPGPKEDPNPGEVTGAWARFVMRFGGSEATMMTRREIDAGMAKSPSVRMKQKTPWTDDPFSFEEMAKKTVLKRNLKVAPLSPEKAQVLGRALEIEEAREKEEAEVEEAEVAATKPSQAERVLGAISGGPVTEAEKEAIRAKERELAEPGSDG